MLKNKKDLIDLVVLSFKYKNLYNFGYMKYRDWAKRINDIIDIYEHSVTRTIFMHLVKQKIFQKRKTKRKIEYLFNPYNKEWKDPYENYNGVVTFD